MIFYHNAHDVCTAYSSNKFDGVGKYTYASGAYYQGSYADGEKMGEGEYRFANGDLYIGTYKNNKANGKGTYKYVNGDVYEGTFKDDKKVQCYPQGTISVIKLYFRAYSRLAREPSRTRKVTATRATLLTGSVMGPESSSIRTETSTRASGATTGRTARASTASRRARPTRGTLRRD